MGTSVLARGTLIVDEKVRARATELIESAGDERTVELLISTTTGRTLPLSPELANFVDHVLRRVAQGGSVSVMTVPESLTTSAAADLLGVSRPTLMKMIKEGKLASTKTGSHHRLRHADVEALREKREQERFAAFDAMRAVDDELENF